MHGGIRRVGVLRSAARKGKFGRTEGRGRQVEEGEEGIGQDGGRPERRDGDFGR